MTILHNIYVEMKNKPNFVSIYGIWIKWKEFVATTFVKNFIHRKCHKESPIYIKNNYPVYWYSIAIR